MTLKCINISKCNLVAILFSIISYTAIASPTSTPKITRQILIFSNQHYTKHAIRMSAEINHYKQFKAKIILISQEQPNCEDKADIENYDLIISLGRRGLKQAICYYGKVPIYSALISLSHYKATLEKLSRVNVDNNAKISVFYIEPPIIKHMLLTKAFSEYLNKPLKVAAILGENTINRKAEMEFYSNKLDIDLHIHQIIGGADPVAVLKSLVKDHNLIIALPDNGVFDRTNARGMLMIASANNVPVIGYTHASISAGALGTIYTPKYKQMKEFLQIIVEILNGDEIILPPPKHPESYSVAINNTVKRRLLPKLISTEEIYNKIMRDIN